jgi:hypothetical protein
MARRCGPRGCSKPRSRYWKQSLGVDWFAHNLTDEDPGVEGTTPTQQAHSLVVSDKTETTETLEWENPGAVPDAYLLVYKSGSAVTQLPVDGTEYTIGQDLGSGNIVGAKVDSGDALEVTLLSLTAGTTYHYRLFAYNGSGSGIKYRTAPERGHRWVTDSAPATGMIGTSINAAKTLEVRLA